jgi:hypothetical protein
MLHILKFIGFADSSGAPTSLWSAYRGANHGQVLAGGIRDGYSAMFNTYGRAHELSKQDLSNFFSSKSTAGKQVISKTVTTFKALCELADFTEPSSAHLTQEREVYLQRVSTPTMTEVVRQTDAGFTININIQLSLPETTDQSIYEKLFSAMKKYLLDSNSK